MFAGGKVDLLNKNQIVSQLRNISQIHQINYFNISSLPFCNQRNLFIDHYHMNYYGAHLFTEYFSGLFHNKIANKALK